ncbi:hypothetical protein LRP67_16250 [Nocardioides sp. cx-169]|uniref:hypothetical protein n=1 Tax=Nocardioides sp. cx-169 TaxID=2899080 RepID=UPI001E31D6AE|nr:hypothetical protein [Nocardioides sp. cx-169]MCD4535645.1 hypothetical protein [Nocardioides sp. cx-169]
MSVRVEHSIGDLAKDMANIARKAKPDMARVVKRNTREGNTLARKFARASSGPHGLNYFKRITHEMIDPLTGEYGPHGDVAGNAVGGGWRHGPPNNDLPKSADIIGPKFGNDIQDLPGKWFW